MEALGDAAAAVSHPLIWLLPPRGRRPPSIGRTSPCGDVRPPARVLYSDSIFITIIYGCINLTLTVLPLHTRKNISEKDYTDVKNTYVIEGSLSQ